MASNDILVALRRIMRAIDLHSKRIEKQAGLTVPQMLVLQSIEAAGELSVTEIARRVHLSQATVTAILDRLAFKGLIERSRDVSDRRRISIRLTQAGVARLASAPQPMQEDFLSAYGELEPWEQKMLTAAVERIASLMDAADIDAAPILEVGDLVPREDEAGRGDGAG